MAFYGPAGGTSTIGRAAGRWPGACIVMRDVGLLQILLGGLMLLPLLVSLLYGEYYSALSFLLSAILTAGFGISSYRLCRDAPDPNRRHAMLIAAVGWVASAAFGALPFLLAAYLTPLEVAQAFVPAGEEYASSLLYFKNPLHAYFESMSGFTTTGLSMAVHEPSIGCGLLFFRSLTQWIGGAGVIVLSLAIIPRPHVAGVLELYQSETTGTKIRPGVLGTARAIWTAYTGITAIVTLYLIVATALLAPEYGLLENAFHSVNHAMAAVSTGGFSTLDDSIATFQSYAMELAHIPPMLLGAISIPLYYTLFRERRPRVLWQDPQFRSLCFVCAFGVPLLVLLLWLVPEIPDPIREGAFQFISAVSTTGWQTSNIAAWDNSAILVIVWGAMIVGGSAGSTVGGVKLIRAYLISRAIGRQVRKVFLPPDAVIPFKVGDRSLSTADMHREVSDASAFCILYAAILAGSILAATQILGPDVRLSAVIFECVSAQSTVGLSVGITDPDMPVALELLFILQMWVGRLEIFPVIILLASLFSKRGRG